MQPDQVFARLFVCPHVEYMRTNPSPYADIVSFNNSCDFVTRVPPLAWGFRRCGVSVEPDRPPGVSGAMVEAYAFYTREVYRGRDAQGIQKLMVLLGTLIFLRIGCDADLPGSSTLGSLLGRTAKPFELFSAIGYRLCGF